MMVTKQVNEEKKTIQKLVDGVGLEDIAFDDTGWESRVYLIEEGKWVFKFPRMEETRKSYVKEVEAMKRLQVLSELADIPKIQWVGDDYGYIGYEGVVGRTLEVAAPGLNNSQQKRIGQSIGRWLQELHSMKLESVDEVDLAVEQVEFQEKYELSLDELKHHFDVHELRQLERLMIREYPERMQQLGYVPCFCHGDLGYWNIIVKDDLTIGIIDFSDMAYHDVSRDFVGLEGVVLDEVLSVYGERENLREKIELRKRILPVLELPYYMGKNDRAGIEKSVARLRKNLV